MSKEKSASSSKQSSNFLLVLLGILLTVLVVAYVANLFYLGKKSADDRAYVKKANDLRVYSQSIAADSLKALTGSEDGFKNLTVASTSFDADWANLKTTLPVDQVNGLANAWSALKPNIDTLLIRQEALTTTYASVDTSFKLVENLRTISQNTLDKLKDQQSDIRLTNQMQQAAILLESIQHNLNGVLTNFAAIESTSKDLADKVKEFNNIVDMLKQSGVLPNEAQNILLTAVSPLNQLRSNVDVILEKSQYIAELQGVESKILDGSQKLLTEATKVANGIEESTSAFSTSAFLGYLVLLLIIAAVVGMFLVIQRNTRRRLQETARENSVNQEAILQLLDEIGDLADGDLTVSATVSEAFTGAIADSINYSIEQLRDLVQTINQTSGQVSATAENSQSLAMNLAEAAEHQAGEIAGVSTAISEMASSIDRVSATALESENVAKRSVEIAHNGSKIVNNTISGMDTIREQIQDTSKRIKRLGESSQEIGDIIGLIDDIAEQTNILALNAAIQASMAGDAGRGFAVVADEVQRLAERSSAATKQIETLVKAIQTDTNEAVISMEQTTSEVVRGAKLAENAGVALEEIENVSQALAKLIQSISNAARQQASTAAHISRTMDVIQEITSQTSSGSTETAVTIGRLTTMSRDMRKSVEGFKLPNN
ncbi:methyl-accepting chemotaxis protein [Entomomonas sp. E2T0]|uniref:methyl-accepting chemotaxis protein n=1 Tax=Entomomonas sp. E2T0 TaxID=2930213 RepID=UPI002228203A|nr:methyl-accepting chemotaxis protein [Entomomonas sp. E2T0]UYZ84630.1 methyl-accepting chemotaxis protein [Entomomonas sp. E2T0]